MMPTPAQGRWSALALICAGVIGAMACWFSTTAIGPELARIWALEPAQAAWLTNAVQLGFVAGALASSALNLPDIMPMTRLITISALLAALANGAVLLQPDFAGLMLARLMTGVALAGVYPPALKLMATWFVAGRGFAMGLLVGALTLGSALPHLLRALGGGPDWRLVVAGASTGALVSAAIFGLAVREGPHGFARTRFDPQQTLAVLRDRPLRLANLGYFGHMWELYAMWAWLLAWLTAAAQAGPLPMGVSPLTFGVIASGVIGCALGGWLSDRIGRCLTTAGMMAVSGASAALIGLAWGGPEWLLIVIAIIWGITIIGDSAQFSAAASELADPRLVGTALTLQLAFGFALTVIAIWLVPVVAAALGGWRWAFLILLPGPVVGVWAMMRLRGLPQARQLAGGRR
ncbi:MFS transporter [Paracoccus sp. 1_MG-2023]|uniref:MFS transporter n=1 Tax=unclassified Paracoccus (in: a-proteobacteria) TaxID=2688777 RepID=UPI001C097DD8|nr:MULTISPECIES: MFS transporter [unclassified Paracoccus (in: a-proteobacteria)]MBU2956488.1 MFS transporter [Paracoccus sp. C2R09]MDO6669708.1 MFS transporter [Paracoccus sp. 1_MG-2023]